MTPRINLLPHREMKKAQRRREFTFMSVFAVVGALGLILLVGVIIQAYISNQQSRNDFIKAENAKLDIQIKEVASLRQEIESLKARQAAVEGLQANRNEPVQLLDDLVKQTPEGIFLKQLTQTGRKILLVGNAQSNDRVSELLRNLAYNSPYLTAPELIEIKAAMFGTGRDQRRVFEFSLNVTLKDPPKPGAPVALGSAPADANAASTVNPAATGSAATSSTASPASAGIQLAPSAAVNNVLQSGAPPAKTGAGAAPAVIPSANIPPAPTNASPSATASTPRASDSTRGASPAVSSAGTPVTSGAAAVSVSNNTGAAPAASAPNAATPATPATASGRTTPAAAGGTPVVPAGRSPAAGTTAVSR